MTRIEELQGRLGQALERIGRSIEGWDPDALARAEAALAEAQQAAAAPSEPEPAPPPDSDSDALRAALEDERLANAQLEERIKQLRAQAASAPPDAGLQDRLEAQREGMAQLDAELQALRRTNDMLARTADALRAANAQNLGDAALINRALEAELEALRAARQVDAAEAKLVIDTLAPLVEMQAGTG